MLYQQTILLAPEINFSLWFEVVYFKKYQEVFIFKERLDDYQ